MTFQAIRHRQKSEIVLLGLRARQLDLSFQMKGEEQKAKTPNDAGEKIQSAVILKKQSETGEPNASSTLTQVNTNQTEAATRIDK